MPVEKYRGEWIWELGDGALSTFDMAASAVSCALGVQRAFASDKAPDLRIGIQIGEQVARKTQRCSNGYSPAYRVPQPLGCRSFPDEFGTAKRAAPLKRLGRGVDTTRAG